VNNLDVPEGTGVSGGFGSDRFVCATSARPFTVFSGVGRLLEVRVFDVCTPSDIAALTARMSHEASGMSGPPIVFADLRAGSPFSQAVADRWSRDMRSFNEKVARSALLLSPENATFNLQFARVVQCAGSPSRRCFCDGAELREGLRAFLTKSELARVDELLPGPTSMRDA
jgi:hypothetical protein